MEQLRYRPTEVKQASADRRAAPRVTAPEMARQHPYGRSVLIENRSALLRRWKLAQDGVLNDPRQVNRWFPGQRNLLELLEALDEEQVVRIADCGTPLFGLQLRCTDFVLGAYGSTAVTPDRFEQESVHETFMALSARLDAVRTCNQTACVNFGLNHSEAGWLTNFCPPELMQLARDPSLVLYANSSYEYFISAAYKPGMDQCERTMLATMSRRKATPAYN